MIQSCADKLQQMLPTASMEDLPENSRVITELDDYAFVSFSGQDAASFLQGQVSCDIMQITNDNSSLGCYCNTQGRVTALFRCFYFADSYYLRLHNSYVEQFIADISKYKLRAKVNIRQESLGAVGIINLNSQLNHSDYCVTKSYNKRYEIFGNIDSLMDSISDYFYIDNDYWQQLEIIDLIPEIYLGTQNKFLPHNINLVRLGAISFSKGCYRGQEIIARMEYKGKIKRGLVCLWSKKPLALVGNNIYNHDKKPNGTIIRHSKHNILAEVSNKQEDYYLEDGTKLLPSV